MIGVLKTRDFRLLFTGEGVSLLGDQFYFIALPWLVLELTSSTVVLGVVLALQGIPRAAFMLVGGAVTDRFSPRRVMIGSNVARLAIVSALSALVFAGSVPTWTPPITCQKRKVRKRSAWAEAAKHAVAPTLTAWFSTAMARTTTTVVPALMATVEPVPRRAVRKRCAIVLLQSLVPLGLYGRVDGGLP